MACQLAAPGPCIQQKFNREEIFNRNSVRRAHTRFVCQAMVESTFDKRNAANGSLAYCSLRIVAESHLE